MDGGRYVEVQIADLHCEAEEAFQAGHSQSLAGRRTNQRLYEDLEVPKG
jgi:hypothetical protein